MPPNLNERLRGASHLPRSPTERLLILLRPPHSRMLPMVNHQAPRLMDQKLPEKVRGDASFVRDLMIWMLVPCLPGTFRRRELRRVAGGVPIAK